MAVQETIVLKQVHRQKDPEFIKALNEVRIGKLSVGTINYFNSLQRSIGNTLVPILYPIRKFVDEYNQEQLRQLPGIEYNYPSKNVEGKVDCFNVPQNITLKVGAQVMLMKNKSPTLVNGSVGRVIDFVEDFSPTTSTANRQQKPNSKPEEKPEMVPLVKFSNNETCRISRYAYTVEDRCKPMLRLLPVTHTHITIF
ncbi:hypothetical protein DM01DRAFT_156795 [Hesseltinella vesiculosa]|uniref:DNA helicase Pif1-like 2B domain-containing protein n=1 Tax=Hesseltinella vesiculosa TaxID=101127 RepID=A0A1X2G8R3_9FUNG|nr:hypothetical protein DM01DRAFT_156795 [Hesseltinella vesiculosa]